jgi:carbamoyl-phosphate synthase large subunit
LLDELKNDPAMAGREPPAIPLCGTRFAFEKFPQADPTLTTQMKSVGELRRRGAP